MFLNEHILTIPLALVFRKLGNVSPGEVIFSSFVLADNSVCYFEGYLYEHMNWTNGRKAREHFLFLFFFKYRTNEIDLPWVQSLCFFTIILH